VDTETGNDNIVRRHRNSNGKSGVFDRGPCLFKESVQSILRRPTTVKGNMAAKTGNFVLGYPLLSQPLDETFFELALIEKPGIRGFVVGISMQSVSFRDIGLYIFFIFGSQSLSQSLADLSLEFALVVNPKICRLNFNAFFVVPEM